ncbi:MAG: cytochrome c oxidase subunit II [Bacteroidetes bacterium]|nr:cytochrome c oxidase subunit II [Bacteroidota bacterium]
MFESTSPFSDYVDATFLIVVGISLAVLIGLVAAMVMFVIKYSRSKNPHPSNIEGNVTLEILWTVIPLVLFMGMFYLGWEGYLKTVDVPEGAVPIDVTARMWSWTFQYPNGVQTDTLFVPVSTPVKLTLRSLDVNHSLYIPAFRIKKDVIPNRENVMWFTTPKAASYDIACAEYCGLRHAYMYTEVVALDSTAFERWYEKVSAEQSKTYQSIVIAGQ